MNLKESIQRAGISDLLSMRKKFEKFIIKNVLTDSNFNDSIDSIDMSTHDLLQKIIKHGFISYDRKSTEHRKFIYNALRRVFGEKGIVVEKNTMVYCYINKDKIESWGDPVLAYLFMICCAVKDGNEWFDIRGMNFLNDLLN